VRDDPFETRDRGLRRVHTVTASVAAAAIAATGVLAYELAAPAGASAGTVPQTSTTDDGSSQQVAPDDGSTGIQPPAQLPAPVGGGRHHGSSGGS
jgi:hypothetical protein